MRLSEFLRDVGQPVPYYPVMARLFGLPESIFLCRLAWWYGLQRDKEGGWIYKTQEEIEIETGLSVQVQRRARAELKKQGVLEEREERLAHKMFYRINFDRLNDVWEDPSLLQPPKELLTPSLPEALNRSFGDDQSNASTDDRNDASTIVSEQTQKRPSKEDDSPRYEEEIYSIYPHKVARPKALIAIRKALKIIAFDDLKKATLTLRDLWSGVSKEEMHFCPHPTTWFNQERFNDDPSTWRPQQSGKITQAEFEITKNRIDSHRCNPESANYWRHSRTNNAPPTDAEKADYLALRKKIGLA